MKRCPNGYHRIKGECTSVRHKTRKSPSSPTYSKEWSGVSYAPHAKGLCCPYDNEPVHKEGSDAYYCPMCDDYVSPVRC